MFLMIIFMIFGIFGVQMHSESFYYRCRLTPGPVLNNETNVTVWEKDPAQTDILCTPDGMGLYTCLSGTYCGSPYSLGLGPIDLDHSMDDTAINYGVLTFDNFGKALLSIFQIITNDNWALTMYNLMNVANPVLAALFLCVLVFFGSFFIVNLILAVILDSFINVQQEDIRKKFIFEHLENMAGYEEM